MDSSTRLQKVLHDALGISRRQADDDISENRVTVNGQPAVLGMKVDPATDQVVWRGQPVQLNRESMTIMLHKSGGCVTTRSDPQGRRTVYDLLPETMRHLFPVGRLDFETEGLLLLTTDGELAYRLTHPKFEVEKEYFVLINRPLGAEGRRQIESGLNCRAIVSAPAQVRFISPERTEILMTMREGQKREIRRIFMALGHDVKYLKRIRLGPLTLGSLPYEGWRPLSPAELSRL